MAGEGVKELALFTGCVIPSRFPFIEVASRRVLQRLGVTLRDIEGASCCPNQMAIQSSDVELWYALAARNLCLAEAVGLDVLVLCNGCYDTLRSVGSELASDDGRRERVNQRLAGEGLELRGTVDVKHVVQVLRDDVGLNAIDKATRVPLDRYRFAAFAGCHARRPMDHMGFDDPEEPYYLRDVIGATGGRPVDYAEERSCCAGGFSIGRREDVVPSARRILRSAADAGAGAVVVNCPYCFAQLLSGRERAREIYFEELDLPVLYVTQLLGLALGIDPGELGMDLHYAIGSGQEERLVASVTGEAPGEEGFTGEVTRAQLETCRGCMACVDDCQTAMTVPGYRPDELVELVLAGRWEEAAGRPDIWFCLNCHECIQHCPQGFGMVRLLVHLKNMAVARGVRPEVLSHRMEELLQTGYSFAPDEEARAECGLGEMCPPDAEAIRRLAEKTTREGG